MWEGLDRFVKTQEVVGQYCVELKEFQHSTELRHRRNDEEMGFKLTKTEFHSEMKKFKDKIFDKIQRESQTASERADRIE